MTDLAPAAPTEEQLAESYRECRRLHKLHGTTYYYATRMLPRAKQPSVHALYGLARYADEIVDAFDSSPVENRASRLDDFERRFLDDLTRRASTHPVLAAVVDTATTWGLGASLFERFFSAMRADLTVTRYATYGELCGYMDGSAAVIGEMMFPILEPRSTSAFEGARNLGIAFQLTNFLRDVGEDLDRGRVYFPTDELAQFGADIEARIVDDAWRSFCRFQIARMRELYDDADAAIELLPPASARSIRAARILYSEILDAIEASDFDVFTTRNRVSTRRKLTVTLRELTRR